MSRCSLFLVSLIFAISSWIAQAQTNTDTATNAPATTLSAPAPNTAPDQAPASAAPASPVNAQDPNAPGATPGDAKSAPSDDIEDIRPPFFFSRSWLWLWISLAAVGLLALIFLLWSYFKPNKILSPRTAYELALEKLEKARALMREENPMPYAIMVSEAIRSYLGQRFQTPSTRRTTEEFLRQMEADQTTPLAEHRDLLRHFLQGCDLVKFARYVPTHSELEEAHQRAVSFVTATKPVPAPSHQNGRLP